MNYSEAIKNNKNPKEEKQPPLLWSDEVDENDTTVEVKAFINNNKKITDNELEESKKQLEKSLHNYVTALLQTNKSHSEDNIKKNTSQLFSVFSKCINLSSLTYNFPNAGIDSIDLSYFKDSDTVLLSGNKFKYGLIVGKQGKMVQELRKKFNLTELKIPDKKTIDKTIVIKGEQCILAAYDIVNLLT